MVEKEGATIVAEYMLARSMIFREESGSQATYHFDWIGSARALTDAAQTVTATYNYEAFGTVVGSTGSSTNAYKYDGAWRYRDDGDFGLVHVGARYYEPGVGRWVSGDAIPGEGAAPQSLNLFAYAKNQASVLVDVTGMQALHPNCWAFAQMQCAGLPPQYVRSCMAGYYVLCEFWAFIPQSWWNQLQDVVFPPPRPCVNSPASCIKGGPRDKDRWAKELKRLDKELLGK